MFRTYILNVTPKTKFVKGEKVVFDEKTTTLITKPELQGDLSMQNSQMQAAVFQPNDKPLIFNVDLELSNYFSGKEDATTNAKIHLVYIDSQSKVMDVVEKHFSFIGEESDVVSLESKPITQEQALVVHVETGNRSIYYHVMVNAREAPSETGDGKISETGDGDTPPEPSSNKSKTLMWIASARASLS